jgi:hypothetical protein
MQLQERGKLQVSDPVVKYLPAFSTPNAEYTRLITIHHLLTHSAGLPPLPSLFPAMGASFRADQNRKHCVPERGIAGVALTNVSGGPAFKPRHGRRERPDGAAAGDQAD